MRWWHLTRTKVFQIFHLLVLMLLIGLPPGFLADVHRHPHNEWRTIFDVAAFIIMFAIIIGYAWRVFRSVDQHPTKRPGTLRWVLGGYAAILVGNVVLGQLNLLLYHQSQTANNSVLLTMLHSSPVVMVVMGISAFTFTPVAEELIFRGVVTNVFFRRDRFWPKVILSGLLFSVEHLSTTPVSFLVYVYMGMVLAYVYRRSGQLHNSILLHALNNLASIAILLG